MTTDMMGDFNGKAAFVTGAGSGIGRATALAFAERGANVTLFDLSEEGNREAAARIGKIGGKSLSITGDVTQGADVKAAVEKTVETFGRLDFAFNNAGIEQPGLALADVSEEMWDRILDINLRGVFLGMKYQIPQMLKQGGGAIVNTSSGAGVIGIARQAAYTASKYGVVGLTKAAALDYVDRNIRINSLCPGITDTEMIERFSGGTEEGKARAVAQEPIGRLARPEEMAGMIMWLCSDMSSFMIGQAIVVDGGQTVGIGHGSAVSDHSK